MYEMTEGVTPLHAENPMDVSLGTVLTRAIDVLYHGSSTAQDALLDFRMETPFVPEEKDPDHYSSPDRGEKKLKDLFLTFCKCHNHHWDRRGSGVLSISNLASY